MDNSTAKSDAQQQGEARVDAFRRDLGPFVVAAEKTRMPMIFTDADPVHSVVFANDAFLALTGYARPDVLGKSFNSMRAGGVGSESVATVEAAFRGESDSEPEVHYRRKDGSQFWTSLFVSPVCDESGAVVQHFVSLVDLTKHQENSARSKMLIDELNHRVKNTLATVQSIVNVTLRDSAEPPAIRDAIESRILALARSHDLLTSGQWEGAGLRDLVVLALQPFEVVGGEGQRFAIAGDNLRIAPKTVLALAITLHELATNAVKYGALSDDVGMIAIDWAVAPGASGDRLVLQWREHDGPPVTPPARRGFGSWVIERGLAHELGGKVTLAYPIDGVTCTIDIPAPARSDG